MTRGTFTGALAVAVTVLTLGGCGGDGGGNNTGGGGGTVVVGMRSDFGGFNPITSSALYSMELMNYALFTPLIQYDDDLQPRPHLAESWELTGDTGVVFHLRRDVRWHDGRPVTAEDVSFTFDRVKAPETASLIGTAFLADVDRAEVVDSFTIRFHFARPHAQALEDFWWAPAPKHLLESVAPADLRNAPYNRQPVGSGPFRLAEWTANQQVVLEANPDYPEGLGGPPASQRIVIRIIPEAATMLTELMTGNLHVDVPLNPDQTQQVEQNDQTELHAFPGRTVYYLGWNNEKPPFNDPALRRALALAINRQEIVDALLYGQGEIATSPIPPWHPLNPGVEPVAHDLAQAQQALEQAGWVDGNGDGIREKDGRPLQFTLLTSDDALRRSVVEVLQSQLRQVGAQADIRVTEFQTMLSQHRARDYDAIFTNWVLDNFQVAAAPFALFHSSLAEVAESSNRSGVRIPELDALIERGGASTDPEQAKEAWREVTNVLQRDQPVTFMFWLNEMAATRSDMTGVRMDPRGEFMSIHEWAVGR